VVTVNRGGFEASAEGKGGGARSKILRGQHFYNEVFTMK
jgi:hypothetical protein